MRTENKNKSRLIRGIEKVIDRQSAKERKTSVDIGMQTYKRYTNKTHCELNTIQNFYFPLTWQPLKYAIKRTAHTVYTYSISSLPFGKERVKRIKKKYNKINF